LIQAQRDLVELRLRDGGQVGSSREVLPREPIRVFVRSTLSGALWIAEVDLHIGGNRKLLVFGHFQPAVPRQRAPPRGGEFSYMPTQGGNDNFRIFVRHLDQHGKARVAFYQSRQLQFCPCTSRLRLPGYASM
jgi:hypothetical protein